ncbi:unnamed protein product [Cylicocyclus nassatus]|uniref:Uncharacterized protein n=1 Tax=Cylicocyclus nassatus TaxID=53992 RepID=A0AA36H1V1_CYLNA|nr:unnamed protein product [Cylicocyclus nassatus]
MNYLVFIFPFLFFAIVPATTLKLTAYQTCYKECNNKVYEEPLKFVSKNSKAELKDAEKEFTCYKRCYDRLTDKERQDNKQRISTLPPVLKALLQKVLRSKAKK